MDTQNTSRQLRYLEEVRTPLHRRVHRRENAGVYDRYGSRPAAQSQRAGWRLPYPR